jgi:hypothetical protein
MVLQMMQEDPIMRLLRNQKIAFGLVVFTLTWLMGGQGADAVAGSDRIYPANRVTLHRGG